MDWSAAPTVLTVGLSTYLGGEILKDCGFLQRMFSSVLKKLFMATELFLVDFAKCNDGSTASLPNVKVFYCKVFLSSFTSAFMERHPNPGPTPNVLETPDEFRSRCGLGIMHLNVRSLLRKLDLVKVWIESTNADIPVLSETWLNKAISDKEISVTGYNVFCCD